MIFDSMHRDTRDKKKKFLRYFHWMYN